MSTAAITAVTAYFQKDPEGLFRFLREHMQGPNSQVPVYIWVDNDDHRTSSEFYALRKLIRSGLNAKVYINPPLKTEREVFDFLEAQVGAQ